jgi:hypothetical protein
MAAGQRVKRLNDMVDRIERLPASEVRDRLLREVRSRAVDLDTGVTPRAMLPLREPAAPAAPMLRRPPTRNKTTTIRRAVSQPPAPAVEPPRSRPAAQPRTEPQQSVWRDDHLSLEDTLQRAPLPYVRVRGNRTVPPWTFGLRG